MNKTKKNKDFVGTLRNSLIVKGKKWVQNQGSGIIQIGNFNQIFFTQQLFKFQKVYQFYFLRQLNLYGFQSHKSNKQEIMYINESFNFETDKRLKKQHKIKLYSENIEQEQKRQFNQLLQLQQNQKQMIEQIKTIINTQEEMKEKMRSQLSVHIRLKRQIPLSCTNFIHQH
ncbi:unnamed protein product [Paramecium sonneborni]|uniref:HSF-type DNA-binding domain-containing protein n=1 Tax=Paramecium sonneborni TaxID=65129 RepID=A0A8S1NT24_9CILI|nr:unnamed protein product [Paramecium sonneborni]